MIGDDIVITFLESRSGDLIRIGIDAPSDVNVARAEIAEPEDGGEPEARPAAHGPAKPAPPRGKGERPSR